MKCKDYSIRQVLIGLHRVGIVGLNDAIRLAETADLEDQEAIVDFILASLKSQNYIPDEQLAEYRRSLWREYLRHHGEDFSELYTEVAVTVCGEPGEGRDRFVELTRSAMALFELRPVIGFAPPGEEGPNPQLIIGGDVVTRGPQTLRALEGAVRKSLSDW
jgi:hypothetical protein